MSTSTTKSEISRDPRVDPPPAWPGFAMFAAACPDSRRDTARDIAAFAGLANDESCNLVPLSDASRKECSR